jgi:iron-sulfur cluster repair protein YtfE (RIC family)
MQPNEIRERILRNHEALRTTLEVVETAARRVLEGTAGRDSQLRKHGDQLLDAVQQHLSWEDQHLAPALRDAWGAEQVASLREGHGEQRQVVQYVSEKLRDPRRPISILARNLLDFTALLREELAAEEKTYADPKLLRDDVIGVRLGAS